MPSIPLHPPTRDISVARPTNPLPTLLHTPTGLALLELQGTINAPNSEGVPIGKLVFPLYDSSAPSDDIAWMKKVWMYVGKHQRMTGEVKKLGKPLAVIRRRETKEDIAMDGSGTHKAEELEIVELVKHKIVFGHRPEPVSVELAQT